MTFYEMEGQIWTLMFLCVTAQVPETFYKYKTEDVLALFFASDCC